MASAQLPGEIIKHPKPHRVVTITPQKRHSATTRSNPTPEDMCNRGSGYYDSQNYPEAVKWFRKAAEQGYGRGSM